MAESDVPKTDAGQTLVQFASYLKEQNLQINATQRWSVPSPSPKAFNLVIAKERGFFRRKIDDEFVYQTTSAQVADDILFKKSSIELEKIFVNAKGVDSERNLILIEGGPGSGKTTLSVYICQSWGRGELFQEFTIVVLVQLRDPAVQSARAIADLLPCENKEMSAQVARAITDINGRGTLWILDGWDELPQSLCEESFLSDIFASQYRYPITQSSVIVTSRPDSFRILRAFRAFATLQIDLLGFTSEQQRQYFTECLKGDTKSVDTLVEKLSTDPAMGESFYLPLNASIIAYCYVNDGTIPTSVQGIFSSFVEHCLSRYQSEKLGKTAPQASLQSLPQELQAPFDELCKVAFMGIEENRLVFSLSDLSMIKDLAGFCEVGLLQVAPSISGEATQYYSFAHSSVQVFLAALHISRLPASRQISMCESQFGEPRFLAVFKFYAAITKLRTSRPFLSKLPHWLSPIPTSMLDIIRKIVDKQNAAHLDSYQPKHLLVSLLDYVQAAHDPSLCQFIAKRLNGSLDIWKQGWLTSADCLAIGYFLSSISVSGYNAEEFTFELYQCAIGDIGTRSLMQGILYRSMDPRSKVRTQLLISLSNNDIKEEGASNIAQVLKNSSMVRGLDLSDNPIGDNGLRMIFDSLKHNNTLDFLDVARCQLTDTGVASLADALNINGTLKTLHIEDNFAITESGIACLVEVISRRAGLETLILPRHLPVDKVIASINDERAKNGLTAIAKKLH